MIGLKKYFFFYFWFNSLDLSSWSDSRKKLTEVFQNVELDGLVNNAGITICKPFEQLTEQDYDKWVTTELFAKNYLFNIFDMNFQSNEY